MKFYIHAMSDAKRKIESTLRDATPKVIEHIAKLILMPDSESRNHWEKEIVTFIGKVSTLKGSNKWPTAKQIFSWTYGVDQDLVQRPAWVRVYMRNIARDEGCAFDPSRDYSIILDYICYHYFTWLSEQLSQQGIIDHQEAYALLDDLLADYSL